MTSKPLMAATGVELGEGPGLPLGVDDGDSVGDGDADAEAEAEADGEGDDEPWRVKLAQGLGATDVQSLWTPGASPANGFTCAVKFPLESAVEEPATLLWSSQ